MMKEDPAAQHRVWQESCGLWLSSARALLVLTGEDRERLLNGLVTCEIKDLAPGQGVRGFFTDVKGHILADVVIRAAMDRLWLELPASVITTIATHIEKYIVVDRVEVRLPEDRQALTLLGPSSSTVLAPMLDGPPIPTTPWSHIGALLRGHEALISVDGHFGAAALTVWSSTSATAEIRQDLLATQGSAGLAEVDEHGVEILRVEAGIPRFGVDYGAENLPQETGLDDAVSYSKGCYLGQEVVARLHYRGQAARRLCRLRSSADELPAIGCRLGLDGREAGTVTSAVRSPLSGEISALAMLQRRATAEGTELLLDGGGSMRVI